MEMSLSTSSLEMSRTYWQVIQANTNCWVPNDWGDIRHISSMVVSQFPQIRTHEFAPWVISLARKSHEFRAETNGPPRFAARNSTVGDPKLQLPRPLPYPCRAANCVDDRLPPLTPFRKCVTSKVVRFFVQHGFMMFAYSRFVCIGGGSSAWKK